MADDPLSAALAEIRERNAKATMAAPMTLKASAGDAVDCCLPWRSALSFHVPGVIEGSGPPYPFRYCGTCSGHPKWPRPEVTAIMAAVTGKEPA